MSSNNAEALVKPHQPPVGGHSSCQNQKVNEKVNDVRTTAATQTGVFLFSQNVFTDVRVVTPLVWCSAKRRADFYEQPGKEKGPGLKKKSHRAHLQS